MCFKQNNVPLKQESKIINNNFKSISFSLTTILDMCHSQKVDGWMDIWMNGWMNRWKEKGRAEGKKEGMNKGRNEGGR